MRLFFGLHLYLAGRYGKNPKVPVAQLNVNPARAITWFVDVTICGTFFSNNSPPLMQQTTFEKISFSKAR